MSSEVVAVLAIHWWKAVIGVVLTGLGWKVRHDYVEDKKATEKRFKSLEDKSSDTYTKDETEKLIDSRVAVPNEKISKIEKSMDILLKKAEDSQQRSDERDEKLLDKMQEFTESINKHISTLNTNVAVIQTKVEHLDKDKDK